jgi:hypothetical protein
MTCTWIAELMLHRIVSLELLSPPPPLPSSTAGSSTAQGQGGGKGSGQGQGQGVDGVLGGVPERTPHEVARIAAVAAFKDFLRKNK